MANGRVITVVWKSEVFTVKEVVGKKLGHRDRDWFFSDFRDPLAARISEELLLFVIIVESNFHLNKFLSMVDELHSKPSLGCWNQNGTRDFTTPKNPTVPERLTMR